MNERLQDFHDSTYERPNQPRYLSRVESAALSDGKAAVSDGNEVVISYSTLRTKRKIFTVAVTTFIVGAMLILFNSPFRNEFMMPGPLVSSHAQILAERGASRCDTCHSAADKTFSQWLGGMFSSASAESRCQSDLCMECHKNTLVPEFARNPHNVDPAELARRSSRFQPASFRPKSGLAPPLNKKNELACSACHREHHGSADLTTLTDKQCQTCHTEDYHSFEKDHPEFTSWPNKRREQIAFDHASHGFQHFPNRMTSFDCALCHIDDSFNNVKLLAPYAKTCAHCHDDQIRESGESGLAVFALPMLDLDAIRNANCEIGNWPEQATGDFDGPIPPVMRVLLSTDEKANKALNYFGAEFGFSDVDPDNVQQVKFACDIVWSIKYLLYDLSVEGPEAIRKRLEMVADRPIGRLEMAELAADLNEPVFQDAVRRWLPGLNVEVAKNRWGSTTMKIGWIPGEILARYEDNIEELLAPNPLNGLIKPLDPVQARPGSAATATPIRPEIELRPESATVSNVPNPGTTPPPAAQNSTTPDANSPDVLAVNPLRKLMEVALHPTDQAEAIVENTTGPEPQPELAVNSNQPPEQTPTPNHVNANDANPSELIELRGVVPVISKGGWFRDDQIFQVTYRPGGHADRCIQSWTEFVTRIPDANVRPDTSTLFAQMTSVSGVGNCRSCHTVDQLADDSFKVNWQPEYRNVSVRSFTRFSHGAHVMQPMLQDCKHCHELDADRNNKDSFVSFDSSMAVSNFKPIKKSNCTTCHREGKTSNSCTQCHNYHIGSQVIGTNHK